VNSAALVWIAVLGAGFLSLVALLRAGSLVFWRPSEEVGGVSAKGGSMPMAVALSIALTCGIALVVLAAPVQRYLHAAAADLHTPRSYVQGVLGAEPVPKKILVADKEELPR
jgi:multicomponent K+:H+ antiporter subunit D